MFVTFEIDYASYYYFQIIIRLDCLTIRLVTPNVSLLYSFLFFFFNLFYSTV